MDFDGDGYRDLQLLATWGATGNLGYIIWRYRPDTDRLQRDDLLSDLGNPTPVANGRCVLTRGTGGAAGRIFSESVLCWRDARLVEVERVRQDVDAAAFIRRAWRALPGADTLVLVATDTLPAG